MTRAEHRVLRLYLKREGMGVPEITPRYRSIYLPVVRKLFEDGYLKAADRPNGGFRNGYVPLVLTDKGRAAAHMPQPEMAT